MPERGGEPLWLGPADEPRRPRPHRRRPSDPRHRRDAGRGIALRRPGHRRQAAHLGLSGGRDRLGPLLLQPGLRPPRAALARPEGAAGQPEAGTTTSPGRAALCCDPLLRSRGQPHAAGDGDGHRLHRPPAADGDFDPASRRDGRPPPLGRHRRRLPRRPRHHPPRLRRVRMGAPAAGRDGQLQRRLPGGDPAGPGCRPAGHGPSLSDRGRLRAGLPSGSFRLGDAEPRRRGADGADGPLRRAQPFFA